MTAAQAGTVSIAGRTLPRFGYGTMRLTGPRIWGPPADPEQAIAVLRRAIELGVRVIDTAWYYGLDVANELVARALSPYLDDLLIVTKLGATRTENGAWRSFVRPEQLREGNERDRRILGLDTIPVTHLRWADGAGEAVDGVRFADAFETMLELKSEGKIGEIGLSNVTVPQLAYALGLANVATVSNLYSLTDRSSQDVLDRCTAEGIPFLPFFPLAVGKAGLNQVVAEIASEPAVTGTQVALAWLLAKSPIMLPIPGTSSVAHLEENVEAAGLRLPADALAKLDAAV
jgi:pyridoxine 4-dehydrogenase